MKTGTSGEALMDVCIARAWLSFARTAIASESLDKAEKIDASIYDLKLVRALVDVVNGNHDDAVTKLKALTAATTDHAEGFLWLGRELLVKGDRAGAVAPLKKARDLDADWPEVQLELARALPDGIEARDVARLAVSMRNDWPDAEARLGELELATGDANAAKTAFEVALKKNPKHVAAKIGLAWALVKLKKFDDAKTAAIDAEKLAANSARARMAHAEALAGLGEVDEAVETFKLASGLDTKDPTPLVRAAQVLLDAKQPMKAEGSAAAAVKQFPNDGRAWEVMGDVDVANGDKKDAKDAYKKALACKEGAIDKSAVQKKMDAIK
jgi:tetratricopeptide (TPR) repeat protein